MIKTIRAKLIIVFFITISTILVAVALVNSFGLEKFYRNKKINEIKNAYEIVDALIIRGAAEAKKDRVKEETEINENTIQEDIKKDEDGSLIYTEGNNKEDESGSGNINIKSVKKELSKVLSEYSNKYNISMALIDSGTNSYIMSSERDGEILLERVQALLFDKSGNHSVKQLLQTDNYRIVQHYIGNMDTSFIEFIGYCRDNQTLILMSTSISSLKESVELSNRFLFYIALAALFLGTIFIFFVSSFITKPIVFLADISKKMGSLDFEAKYTGENADEIGVLGNNMNIMADKLKETITELKDANEKLQEDIKKKDELEQLRKDFIANVSHELKTPIALIQGYAEGLNEGMCEDKESREYYTEVIIDEANKMNIMVKQLLALSELESGNLKMQKTEFNISELIQGVLDTTKILLINKEVELNFVPQDVYVYADEFKIEEVITNFVRNAINHVSDKGRISIDIEDFQEKVKIKVFNTGKHIPDKDLLNIWEKFYKVDKAHSRAYGGSGIGLSIVKAIIQAHEAECGVINKADGVEFWFELSKLMRGRK